MRIAANNLHNTGMIVLARYLLDLTHEGVEHLTVEWRWGVERQRWGDISNDMAELMSEVEENWRALRRVLDWLNRPQEEIEEEIEKVKAEWFAKVARGEPVDVELPTRESYLEQQNDAAATNLYAMIASMERVHVKMCHTIQYLQSAIYDYLKQQPYVRLDISTKYFGWLAGFVHQTMQGAPRLCLKVIKGVSDVLETMGAARGGDDLRRIGEKMQMDLNHLEALDIYLEPGSGAMMERFRFPAVASFQEKRASRIREKMAMREYTRLASDEIRKVVDQWLEVIDYVPPWPAWGRPRRQGDEAAQLKRAIDRQMEKMDEKLKLMGTSVERVARSPGAEKPPKRPLGVSSPDKDEQHEQH
jgi:uncharacterized protein YqiB (DUF1249 family)